jgi:DNA-binding NtrC family response regulator
MIILHVDDDHQDRAIFAEALKEVNPDIKMITAEDGEKALALLKDGILKANLNYMFLDVTIPLMDGVGLIALIRGNQRLSKVSVYVCSTTTNEKAIMQIEKLGATFIQKKSDYKALVRTLENIFKKTHSV